MSSLRLLPVALILSACTPNALPIQRDDETQVLHLDVGTEHEANSIRRVVLAGWSQSADDDLIITRMVQSDGTPFWCIRRAEQEDRP